MNLTLGFPDPSGLLENERVLARRTGLAGAIARFEEWMADPDSPVRAIRRQPAKPGVFAGFPEDLGAVAQAIPGLARHPPVVLAPSPGLRARRRRPQRGGGDAHRLRQDAVLQPAGLGTPDRRSGARALYLFPTKALAEDQLAEFQGAVDAMGSEIRAFTYDGDTPQDARRAIRERANVVLTNPDMLHSGILPHHTKWAKAFENLRYIVIDELHSYRGVYGSHLANVLRRLKRVCEFYGSSPQFICCSATIANPRELAQALTGQRVRTGFGKRRSLR